MSASHTIKLKVTKDEREIKKKSDSEWIETKDSE